MEVETGAGEGAEPDVQFGLVRVTASVEPGGLMTRALTLLFAVAGGVAVGKDGALYVTNNSIFSGTGQVVRIAQ